MKPKWHFSLLLLGVYLAIFHFWMRVDAGWRIASTAIVAVLLTGLLVRAAKGKYFANRWDLSFHACVIADIGLEGFLVIVHDNFGFYLCALAFVALIAGYRTSVFRKQITQAKRSVDL